MLLKAAPGGALSISPTLNINIFYLIVTSTLLDEITISIMMVKSVFCKNIVKISYISFCYFDSVLTRVCEEEGDIECK